MLNGSELTFAMQAVKKVGGRSKVKKDLPHYGLARLLAGTPVHLVLTEVPLNICSCLPHSLIY